MSVDPGVAEPLEVSVKLNAGAVAVVVSVTELLPEVGSGSLPVTVAVLATDVVNGAGALNETATVLVDPDARLLTEQENVPLLTAQPLVLVVAPETPLGNGSLRVKPVDASGPLLVTVKLSVIAPPGFAVAVPVPVTARSTRRGTVTLVELAELFPALESVSV